MDASASIIRWCRESDGDQPITVHSKIIIIDDDFVRVGSSNINNRSTALDTELDLAIEVEDDARRRTIAGLRDNLIAEHLDSTPEAVHETFEAEGSLLRTIEKLGCNARCLRRLADDGQPADRPGVRHLAARSEAAVLPVPAQKGLGRVRIIGRPEAGPAMLAADPAARCSSLL